MKSFLVEAGKQRPFYGNCCPRTMPNFHKELVFFSLRLDVERVPLFSRSNANYGSKLSLGVYERARNTMKFARFNRE